MKIPTQTEKYLTLLYLMNYQGQPDYLMEHLHTTLNMSQPYRFTLKQEMFYIQLTNPFKQESWLSRMLELQKDRVLLKRRMQEKPQHTIEIPDY